MKAARLLATAGVVVHDALVGDGVLALIPHSAERIDVVLMGVSQRASIAAVAAFEFVDRVASTAAPR